MSVLVSDPDVTIHVGDATEVLQGLPDGSVDCCVTSPPYWGLRDYGTGSWDGGNADCDHASAKIKTRYDYSLASSPIQDGSRTGTDGGAYKDQCECGARRVDHQLGLEATPDEYVANMIAVFREVRRVLTDHGTLWINLGDSYNNRISTRQSSHQRGLVGIPWRVAFALQADSWYLRSDIIWAKPNPMPESVTDRPTKAHEYVFLLSKRPRYWFDAEAVREKAVQGTDLGLLRGRSKDETGKVAWAAPSIAKRQAEGVDSRGGRNVRSVWEIATQPYPDAHFATFPEELPRRCILAGCPEGGVVLDPFIGSGTTALVARNHGRNCVGIELNPVYAALAARRLQQLSLLAVPA